MTDYNSIVPVVANAAITVSGNITDLIVKARAGGVIHRAQIEMLKDQTAKVIADARSHHTADIIMTNLDQIAKTQEHIDYLAKIGRLHGISLNMAMDQLSDLNDTLRRNLRRYENRELW